MKGSHLPEAWFGSLKSDLTAYPMVISRIAFNKHLCIIKTLQRKQVISKKPLSFRFHRSLSGFHHDIQADDRILQSSQYRKFPHRIF